MKYLTWQVCPAQQGCALLADSTQHIFHQEALTIEQLGYTTSNICWGEDLTASCSAHLAGSSSWAGMSSSWLTAHSARMKMTTASPSKLLLLMYTFSMPSLPRPSAQFAYMMNLSSETSILASSHDIRA